MVTHGRIQPVRLFDEEDEEDEEEEEEDEEEGAATIITSSSLSSSSLVSPECLADAVGGVSSEMAEEDKGDGIPSSGSIAEPPPPSTSEPTPLLSRRGSLCWAGPLSPSSSPNSFSLSLLHRSMNLRALATGAAAGFVDCFDTATLALATGAAAGFEECVDDAFDADDPSALAMPLAAATGLFLVCFGVGSLVLSSNARFLLAPGFMPLAEAALAPLAWRVVLADALPRFLGGGKPSNLERAASVMVTSEPSRSKYTENLPGAISCWTRPSHKSLP